MSSATNQIALAVLSTLLVVQQAWGQSTPATHIQMVWYQRPANATDTLRDCKLYDKEDLATRFGVSRGDWTNLPYPLSKSQMIWDGVEDTIDVLRFDCDEATDDCRFTLRDVKIGGTCHDLESNTSTPEERRLLNQFTLYMPDVDCPGQVSATPSADFAVVAYEDSNCGVATGSVGKGSKMQLYESLSDTCKVRVRDGSEVEEEYYQIKRIPHESLAPNLWTFQGVMACADNSTCSACSPDNNSTCDCEVKVNAWNEGVCESADSGGAKIGRPNELSKECGGASSSKSAFERYGWQLTAAGVWFVCVIGAAVAIRQCHKMREKRRQYISINESPGTSSTYGSSLGRSENGRVGMSVRDGIKNQEEALAGANPKKSGIISTEEILAAVRSEQKS